MSEMSTEIQQYKELLDHAMAMINASQTENKNLKEELADLKNQLLLVKEENAVLRNKIYGRKSEKTEYVSPSQLSLFNEAEAEAVPLENEQYTIKEHVRRKHAGQIKEKFQNVPHRKVVLTMTGEDLNCPECGGTMVSVGEEFIRHELRFIPAQVYVDDVYQQTYECRHCKTEDHKVMKKADLPERVIPHSYAGPESVAQVFKEKYVNHVPLYCQEEEWKRIGVELSRGTMANWVIYTAERYLKPLVELMKKELLSDQYCHADETTLQVLKEPGKKPDSKSYMWVYSNITEREHKIRIFDYQPNRQYIHAQEFFKDFRGYIISDAYEAYHDIPNTKNALCWAHARRKFTDALPAKVNLQGVTFAESAIDQIGKMFAVEHEIEGLTPSEKVKIRQEKTKPMLDEYFSWCEKTENQVMSGTKIAKAIQYSLNHREGLSMFLEDGLLPMTNSLDERTVRSMTVGRRNWLFSTSVAGAESSAAAYSIVESAKANGIDVYKYLVYIFRVLPSLDYKNDPEVLKDFLPWSSEIKEFCKKM